MTGSTTRISKLGYGEIEQFLRDLTEEGFGGNHIRDFRMDKPAFREWVQYGIDLIEGRWTTLPIHTPRKAWTQIEGSAVWTQNLGDPRFNEEDGAEMLVIWVSNVSTPGHSRDSKIISLHPHKWRSTHGVQMRRAGPDSIEVRVPARHAAQVTIDESDEWGPERGIELCTGVLVSLGNGIEANVWGPSRPHECAMCSKADIIVVRLTSWHKHLHGEIALHLRDLGWVGIADNIQIRPDPSARNVIWVRNRK